MSSTAQSRGRVLPVVLTPYGDEMAGLSVGIGNLTAPASNTWTTANLARLYPLFLTEPFSVAKAYWCSGATVGVDQIDIAIYQITNQATGRMDLVRSTGMVYSNFPNVVQEAGWAQVWAVNLINAGSSTDATSYATAAVNLSAGKLYVMSVENSHGTAAIAPTGITGGPTFTLRSSTLYNTNLNSITVWTAVPTVNYSGVLTIGFGAATETGCVWSLEEFSGADTTTNDGMVQQVTATGSSVTPAVTLSAFGSVYNCTFMAQGHAANTTQTPKAQFTELADTGTATPAQAIGSNWFVGTDTAPNSTITSAAWGACGLEIKALAAAATPWRIARTALDSGANTTDAASFVTNSMTFKRGRLYILSFTNTKATTPDAASAVTLTTAATAWTSVATKAFSSNASPTQRLTVYSFVPTADYTDTITVAFGATQTGFSWSLVEMSGVDTTTNNGIVQSAIGYVDAGTTVQAALSAFGDARNCTYAVASVNNASAMSAGTGFTQLNTVTYATPSTRMADEWRVDNHRGPWGTWTSGGAAIIALEIKCDTSALVIPPSAPGNPAVYMAFNMSGNTATILRQGLTYTAGYLVAASSFPLPSNLTGATSVAATVHRPFAGFSLRSLIG